MIRITTGFGIIRHAPTLWNEAKRIQGQLDSSLSARGLSMAEKWGKDLAALPWDLLLCSDMGRVQKTVELINHSLHLPVQQDRRLREQDWGSWSGMTLNELKTMNKELVGKQEQMGWDFTPPGGESRCAVLARSLAALSDAHGAHPGRNILVVCHEGVIKCLLYKLLNRKFMPEEPKIIQGFHLHLMGMEGDTLTLKKMNALEMAGNKHRCEG